MSNQVVVQINDSSHLLECVFLDGVSQELFEHFLELNRLPGWSVDYGTNTHKGGLDKSIVEIYHNRAKRTEDAARILEEMLERLGFRLILWNRGTLKGNRVSEVFDKGRKSEWEYVAEKTEVIIEKTTAKLKASLSGSIFESFHAEIPEVLKRYPPIEIPIEAASKVEMFEVWFTSEAIAKCVASYFTNAEVVPDTHGCFVRSLLLDKGTVLRILRKHHLRTDGFSIDTYWV